MRSWCLLMITPALIVLSACQQQVPQAAEPTVHDIMKNKVDANADALWDLTNPALNNDATLNPNKIDDARWSQMANRAQAVADAAGELANLKTLKLVDPGQKIADQDSLAATLRTKCRKTSTAIPMISASSLARCRRT